MDASNCMAVIDAPSENLFFQSAKSQLTQEVNASSIRSGVHCSCVGAHARSKSRAACQPPSASTTPHQLCRARHCSALTTTSRSHATVAAICCAQFFHICFSTALALNPQAVFAAWKTLYLQARGQFRFPIAQYNFFFVIFLFSIILLCLQMLYSIMCAIENQLSVFLVFFALFGISQRNLPLALFPRQEFPIYS